VSGFSTASSFACPRSFYRAAAVNLFRRYAGERNALRQPIRFMTDISLQLPSQFLAEVDRATVVQGMEAHVPLLDELLASLAVGLPAVQVLRRAKKDRAARDGMRARLAAQRINGPKTGFGFHTSTGDAVMRALILSLARSWTVFAST